MIDQLLQRLHNFEIPSEDEIKQICNKVKEILIDEPNTVIIYPPISVCGDIHGQFHDLLELFEHGDHCPETSYLFLGDYVDRGSYSIETILYLLCIKIKCPTKITLLRGNHESRSATATYGFYYECNKKFGIPDIYNWCMEVFDLLPFSAMIDNKLFAVHGGISPHLNNIDELYHLNRKQEIPKEGIITDLAWSDPSDDIRTWRDNERRGAGYLFGDLAVKQFNQINNFTCILRAHEAVYEGYHYMFNKQLCTVWSAPNYCDKDNVASILEIDEQLNFHFNIFVERPDYARSNVNDFCHIPAYFY